MYQETKKESPMSKYNVLNCVHSYYSANTKHFYNIRTTSAQRLRRLSNNVQMLYKWFVFTELIYYHSMSAGIGIIMFGLCPNILSLLQFSLVFILLFSKFCSAISP